MSDSGFPSGHCKPEIRKFASLYIFERNCSLEHDFDANENNLSMNDSFLQGMNALRMRAVRWPSLPHSLTTSWVGSQCSTGRSRTMNPSPFWATSNQSSTTRWASLCSKGTLGWVESDWGTDLTERMTSKLCCFSDAFSDCSLEICSINSYNCPFLKTLTYKWLPQICPSFFFDLPINITSTFNDCQYPMNFAM